MHSTRSTNQHNSHKYIKKLNKNPYGLHKPFQKHIFNIIWHQNRKKQVNFHNFSTNNHNLTLVVVSTHPIKKES